MQLNYFILVAGFANLCSLFHLVYKEREATLQLRIIFPNSLVCFVSVFHFEEQQNVLSGKNSEDNILFIIHPTSSINIHCSLLFCTFCSFHINFQTLLAANELLCCLS